LDTAGRSRLPFAVRFVQDATVIAYYALQQVKSGRRFIGSSVVDVMGSGTQLNGNARLSSPDESVDDETGGVSFTFNDVVASDQEGQEPVRALDVTLTQ
jgi:hypothetical protein